jgi:uncharacterized membrane protein
LLAFRAIYTLATIAAWPIPAWAAVSPFIALTLPLHPLLPLMALLPFLAIRLVSALVTRTARVAR